MKTLMPLFTLLGALFMFASAYAAPSYTTYQAKIYKPDGLPLESLSVNFKFTILDPTGSCVLYSEDYTAINMVNSAGLTSFSLGAGTRSFPTSGTITFANVFDNSVTSFSCQSPGIYNPTSNDNRKIVMQFNDGNGWQTLPAMVINTVPYSMYAGKSDNSVLLNGKADTSFVQYTALPTCTTGQALYFNGVSFSCVTASGGSSGVNSVTTSGPVLVTGGTASAPVISITQAASSTSGYLSSTDWNNFNNKLSASSTQIVSTLGYSPVSSSAVANQIASSNLSGDVSGTMSSNSVQSVGGKTSSQISTSVNDTIAATSSNTASTIVKRDGSGNFIANDVYANAAKINYADIYKPSTSFNIRLQAPTGLSTNYVLNLPTTSGTTGQVLSTDGAGTLSWVNPSTGSVISVSATAPLASTGGSNPTISITQATSSTAGYLSSTDWNTFNNKQAATSAAIIATLGYTPANSAVSIDLGSASATGIIADARLQTQSNVTSGTQYTKVTVDGKGRVTSGAQLSSSDVTAALGYTPANDTASGTYLVKASNLSDLTNVATARTNLGLGTFATASSVDLGSASATGTLAIARLPSFTGDATVAAASNTIVFSNSGVTAGSYTKVTVDGKGRVTSSSALVSSDVTTALGYTPASASAATQWTTSGTGIYYNTGNVGVGTTSPNDKLSIQRSAATAAYVGITDGTIRNVLGIAADDSALVGTVSNHDFNIISNGTAKAIIKANGDVGIGTTTPTSKLELSSVSSPILKVTDSDASIEVIMQALDGGTDVGWIGTGTSHDLRIGTSSTVKMTVQDSTGNVGIGTTAPSSKFVSAISSTVTATAVSLYNTDTTDNNGSVLSFRTDTTGAGASTQKEVGALRVKNIIHNDATLASEMGFFTSSNGSLTEKMTITASGNVGIGTTTPSAKLHLDAGTASIAPLKLTSGTLLSSPQSGTMEYDGTNFYLTDSTNTRRTIATGSSAGTIDNASTINSSGNISMVPVGSVIVSSTTASTNSNTGALVVKGGLGVAGNINAAGNLNVSGSQVVDGSLKLSSITSGSVLFAGASGTVTQDNSSFYWDGANKRLGIGSNSPAHTLSVSGTSYFSGNVGVGTTSPGIELDVQNSSNSGSSSSYPAVRALNTLATQGDGSTTWNIAEFLANSGNGMVSARFGSRYDGSVTGYVGTVTNHPFSIVTNGIDNKRLTVTASGDVGIGTTTPSRLLDVKGIMAFEAPNSTNEWLAYTHTDNTYRLNYNGVGNDEVVIDSSGNVGIGTISPTGGKLHVSGGDIFLESGNKLVVNGNAGGNNYLWSPNVANPRLGIFAGGIEKISVNYSDGNVGIGTTSPSFPLDVQSSNSYQARFFHSSNNQYDGSALMMSRTRGTLASNTAVTSGDTIGGIYFRAHDGAGTGTTNSSVEVSAGENHSGTNRGTYMIFETTTNGSASRSEKMRIHSNGNVGIGTMNPLTNLDITVPFNLSQTNTYPNGQNTSGFILRGNEANPFSLYMGLIGAASATNRVALIQTTNQGISNDGILALQPNGGNVGIGTTSPALTLDVSGSVRSRSVAVATTVTSINWSSGNIQYTPDSCQAYTFNNIADGAAYTFIVKGGTSATCSFTLYSGNGSGALTGHYTPALAATTASTHTVFTFFRAGNDVYVSWTSGL